MNSIILLCMRQCRTVLLTQHCAKALIELWSSNGYLESLLTYDIERFVDS